MSNTTPQTWADGLNTVDLKSLLSKKDVFIHPHLALNLLRNASDEKASIVVEHVLNTPHYTNDFKLFLFEHPKTPPQMLTKFLEDKDYRVALYAYKCLAVKNLSKVLGLPMSFEEVFVEDPFSDEWQSRHVFQVEDITPYQAAMFLNAFPEFISNASQYYDVSADEWLFEAHAEIFHMLNRRVLLSVLLTTNFPTMKNQALTELKKAPVKDKKDPYKFISKELLNLIPEDQRNPNTLKSLHAYVSGYYTLPELFEALNTSVALAPIKTTPTDNVVSLKTFKKNKNINKAPGF